MVPLVCLFDHIVRFIFQQKSIGPVQLQPMLIEMHSIQLAAACTK